MFRQSLSKNLSTVATSKMATKSSQFTKLVVEAMRKMYPEKLADSTFDNTGLLLEAPLRSHLVNSVLLTIDLTKAVAEEAIARHDSVIITYHPIIFKQLKSLTLADSQQSTLLRLAQEGISVYSPHTAVDAAPAGLTDWLADIVTTYSTYEVQADGPNVDPRIYDSIGQVPHDRKVITPVTGVYGFENAGYGRIVRFMTPQKLGLLLGRIHEDLQLRDQYLSVAVPQDVPIGSKADIEISSIGICAGSGGSILKGQDVDMFFTGEMSHHEALAAIEQGKVVVTAFHSNTERAFLSSRMKHDLEDTLKEIFLAPRADVRGISFAGVAVSKEDRDPYEIVSAGELGW